MTFDQFNELVTLAEIFNVRLDTVEMTESQATTLVRECHTLWRADGLHGKHVFVLGVCVRITKPKLVSAETLQELATQLEIN